MMHIHGSSSLVKYIHCVSDHVHPGAEIWWFMRMQFSPWNHIINVIIFLDHSIYSNSIGQHRRDPGLVQLGTWNRKHSRIHSRNPVIRFSVWHPWSQCVGGRVASLLPFGDPAHWNSGKPSFTTKVTRVPFPIPSLSTQIWPSIKFTNLHHIAKVNRNSRQIVQVSIILK